MCGADEMKKYLMKTVKENWREMLVGIAVYGLFLAALAHALDSMP